MAASFAQKVSESKKIHFNVNIVEATNFAYKFNYAYEFKRLVVRKQCINNFNLGKVVQLKQIRNTIKRYIQGPEQSYKISEGHITMPFRGAFHNCILP